MYLSQTLIIFWLSKNGFGFSDLIIYYLVAYVVALVGIVYLPKFKINSKQAMFWGIVFSAMMTISILIISISFGYFQLLISAVFSGLNVIFFWIPLNTMFFNFSSSEKRGTNSGMYFLITPIISIFLQPLAGFFADEFGFTAMFLIGTCAYLIPIILIKFIPSFEWNLDVKNEIKKLKFNWPTLFQGMTSRINWSLIPIFSLLFLKTPRQYGNFFGYLAIAAVVATVIIGYISDKLKNRKIFFYLFSTLSVISFVPLAFSSNVYSWGIFAGIASLCLTLANSFWLAFNIDYYQEIGIEKTMALREVFLNSGYILNLLIVFLVFYFTGSAKTSLLAICVICCLLPIVSYWQGVYKNKKVV